MRKQPIKVGFRVMPQKNTEALIMRQSYSFIAQTGTEDYGAGTSSYSKGARRFCIYFYA